VISAVVAACSAMAYFLLLKEPMVKEPVGNGAVAQTAG